ncbi:MAG: tRNA (guanosine(37)-N1)-methyltransferase TrmD [Deltaproteobacteria bacterium]|nr:tRNA (guanosine(37)-N1)-methyltransferase TrmD [Deltaproteobacteria bacterium]
MAPLREIHVLTLFPDLFEGFLRESILGKAVEDGRVAIRLLDFRTFATDKHHSADDVPYGGGSGMVLLPGPAVAALESLPPGTRKVLLTPQGARFDHAAAVRLAGEPRLALFCGRYEGFDERIRAHVDEELSLGDFVLQGGEVAAMAIVEALVRLLPGVLHNADSPREESFAGGLLEYPQYTRPREFRGVEVPEILLSGHHEEIRRWRRREALRRTLERRPELLATAPLTGEDRELLGRWSGGAVERWSGGSGEAQPEAKRRASPPGGGRDAVSGRRTKDEERRTPSRVHVVLVHHPIKSRVGGLITTSVTNLDIHDIARASRTYGVRAYHLVTPIALQQELVRGVASHWLEGESGERVPARAEALSLVRVAESFFAVTESVRAEAGVEPLVVMTTAAAGGRPTVGYGALRQRLRSEKRPVLLVFGTGWGLADELLDRADVLLDPIEASSDYNHLSVRVAVGICLDRLFGDR